MITVTIPNGEAKTADNRDGALVDVHVTNILPCVSVPSECLEVEFNILSR